MAQSNKVEFADLNDDVKEQLSVLRDDIAALTSIVADFSGAKTSQVKSDVQNRAAQLAEDSAAAAAALRGQARDQIAGAEQAVRANPGAAVGIAAGIGFIAGLLTARK